MFKWQSANDGYQEIYVRASFASAEKRAAMATIITNTMQKVAGGRPIGDPECPIVTTRTKAKSIDFIFDDSDAAHAFVSTDNGEQAQIILEGQATVYLSLHKPQMAVSVELEFIGALPSDDESCVFQFKATAPSRMRYPTAAQQEELADDIRSMLASNAMTGSDGAERARPFEEPKSVTVVGAGNNVHILQLEIAKSQFDNLNGIASIGITSGGAYWNFVERRRFNSKRPAAGIKLTTKKMLTSKDPAVRRYIAQAETEGNAWLAVDIDSIKKTAELREVRRATNSEAAAEAQRRQQQQQQQTDEMSEMERAANAGLGVLSAEQVAALAQQLLVAQREKQLTDAYVAAFKTTPSEEEIAELNNAAQSEEQFQRAMEQIRKDCTPGQDVDMANESDSSRKSTPKRSREEDDNDNVDKKTKT
jgi:hypothetical protein